MTKYVLLSEFTPPERGGIQASVGPLIAALGDDLTVVGPQAEGPTHRVVRRSLFSGRMWPRWWWLVPWLRQAQTQGAQTFIFGHCSAAIIAAWLLRRRGVRYVVMVHGNDLLSEQRHWYVWPFVRAALRSAAYVGVNSSFVSQHLRRIGVAQGAIVRTHPFVCQADIPSKLPDRQGTRIVTVARLVPRKNVAVLLETVAALRTDFPHIHLDVVGDGPERKALEEQAAALQITNAVTFHGAVTDQEKWHLLAQADIFVMVPTVRDGGVDIEGLGLVYAEAAAVHLPIVASATGGVTDIVQDGRTGFALSSQDADVVTAAVRKLLQDNVQRQVFGLAGAELVHQEFTDGVRLTRLLQMIDTSPKAEAPLISVIIPTFQSADTIGATIRSVIAQTWTNKEIIIVDDGSTDDVVTAIAPWRDHVQYIRQANAGAPAARNTGFNVSHGQAVLFLDADTVLQPNALERMMAALTVHPEAAYVYSNFYFGWKKFPGGWYDSNRLHQQNYIHTTSLIRRSAQPHFDPMLKKFQDWDLWLTFDERGLQGVWLDQYLFRVTPRRRGKGMSDWLPSFMYRLPGIGQGRGNATIAKYRQAERVIRQKHQI